MLTSYNTAYPMILCNVRPGSREQTCRKCSGAVVRIWGRQWVSSCQAGCRSDTDHARLTEEEEYLQIR